MESRIYKTEGIIIRRRNIGETDKNLLVFTKEHGKIRVLAKGIRKITSRRAGHLDLFNHVILTVYRGRTGDIVNEASRIQHHIDQPSLETYTQTVYLFFLCELIDKLMPEGQKQPDVYDLLLDVLAQIRKTASAVHGRLLVFEFSRNLLWNLGYLPRTVVLQGTALLDYIEQVTERRLRTPTLLTAFRESE